MKRIAFLGLGAMGSRMAANLIAGGFDVTVWNRSPEPADALRAAGAKTASCPRTAAEGAEAVISMVFDDAASAAVWLDPATGAMAGLAQDAVGIEASTVSPGHVVRLHAAAAARGARFVDAPLAGTRPQAEARTLIFLVGGADAVVADVRPVLGAMGNAAHHVGGPGAGSTVKLMVNAALAAQIALLGELIGFAARSGVDPARAIAALGDTPAASPAAKGAAAAMLAGNFAPAAPVDLVAKDMAIAEAAGTLLGAEMPITSATAAVYRYAAAEGYGGQNVTAVVRRYLDSAAAPVSAR